MSDDVSKTEERPHHPYSPSTLQATEWCPCYRSRQSKVVHQRTTAGTRGHKAVETGEDDSRLSDDDAIAVAECLDFVDHRRRLMADTGDPATAFAVTELKEAYLPVDDLVFPDCISTTAGYVDLILINHDETYAEMVDYKFGLWPVDDAKDNLQGISYTLGLFNKYPTLKKIRFFFKQPLLQSLSDWTFSREDIPALYLRVQVVVARAREARTAKDYATAKPGVSICNFCGELGRCPKVDAFACKVGRKFHPLVIPEDITPSVIQNPANTALGLQLALVLKAWADSFRRQVADRVIRGDAPLPPGQRIQSMAKREILDILKFRSVALQYLTEAEWQSTLETSLGAVEDLVSEHAPRGHKKDTVTEFGEALLNSGAVKLGDEFSFLQAIPEKA